MTIDYEGRLFQRAGGGDGTVARYRQDGDLVWADFTGGKVRRGTITGTCGPDGTLRLAYTMVMRTGEVISGHTVNIPERGPDGRLVLREEWERFGEHAEKGVSFLEEVVPEAVPEVVPEAGSGAVPEAASQAVPRAVPEVIVADARGAGR